MATTVVLPNQGGLTIFRESKDRPGLLLPSWQGGPTKLEQLWQPGVSLSSSINSREWGERFKDLHLSDFLLFRSNIALSCTRNIKNKCYVKLVRQPTLPEVLCVYLSVKMGEGLLKRMCSGKRIHILVQWRDPRAVPTPPTAVVMDTGTWVNLQGPAGAGCLAGLQGAAFSRQLGCSSGWAKQRTYFKKKREFAFLICH